MSSYMYIRVSLLIYIYIYIKICIGCLGILVHDCFNSLVQLLLKRKRKKNIMLVFVNGLCDSFDHLIIYIYLIYTLNYDWVVGFIPNYDIFILLYSITLFIWSFILIHLAYVLFLLVYWVIICWLPTLSLAIVLLFWFIWA